MLVVPEAWNYEMYWDRGYWVVKVTLRIPPLDGFNLSSALSWSAGMSSARFVAHPGLSADGWSASAVVVW